MTELEVDKISISISSPFRKKKTDLKFSEGSKAKSPSNINSFPPFLFLIIIAKLIITI